LSKGFVIDNSLVFEFKIALEGFSLAEIGEFVLQHQLLDVEKDF
jgi:hypothetical protein